MLQSGYNKNMSKDKSVKAFIVSTDTCCDLPKSRLVELDVRYLILKRILGEEVISECFDTDKEFDAFYDTLKTGDLPTTTQLTPFEFKDYFQDIFASETEGDIIHISLSSGLSGTYNNAVSAAKEVNREMEKKKDPRRVHVFDSLMATLGQGEQVEELCAMRDKGVAVKDAIAKLTKIRDHQQGWVIMSDLFHLRRGGRISGAKAAIGVVLNIRPIIHISTSGKLAFESKMRGNLKAIKYILSRMDKFGDKYNKDFGTSTVWVVRTSQSELHQQLKASIKSAYPSVTIKEAIVGPIIGTHLGCGGVAVLFRGAPRLDIN